MIKNPLHFFQRFLLCLPAAFSLCLLPACGRGKEAPPSPPPDRAPRVVSLAPALTELIFHLGKGNLLAGRTDVCTSPPDALIVPVAGRFGAPDTERILAIKPSLIVANALINPNLAETFRRAGIRTILKKCATLSDYLEWVDLLGRELSAEEAAKKERKRISDWLARNKTRKKSGKKVLFVLWDAPLTVAGAGTLPDTAIRLAGAGNAAAGVRGYFKCSPEFLLSGKPDAIVWAVEKPLDRAAPFWCLTDCVKHGRVYTGFQPDALLRPGPDFPRGVDSFRAWLEGSEKGKGPLP